MSDMFSKYHVVMTGEVITGHDRDQVLDKLAEMFKSNKTNMEQLLQGHAVPLKKEYDKDQAVRICEKIRNLGAACQLQEIETQSLQLLDEETLTEIERSDPNKRPDDDSEVQYGSNPDGDSTQLKGHERDHVYRSILSFVDTNVDYYHGQFQKFGPPGELSFKLTWHWPAFFFFFLWALYRKIWLWAGLYLVIGAVLMTIANPGIISLVWLLVWPMSANYLYYRYVISAVRTSLEDRGVDRTSLASHFRQGGVSRAAVWFGVILCIGLSSLLTQHFTRQFMESYGEYVEDVLPGSGSQIRGDGSALIETDPNDRKLSNTSLTLSYLATSLKVILVNQKGSNPSQSLDVFLSKIRDNGVKDSWGTSIYYTEERDRYNLISAGPDGAKNTDDDLIQPVPLVQ